MVVTDGAIVFSKGDFDSRVIGYFRQGQKVRVSNKTYGPFYKVRFKQGVIGFVSDVDVVPESKMKGATKTKGKGDPRSSGGKPIFKLVQVGLVGAYTQYTEVIQRAEKTASIFTYGFKFSFPMTLFDGPFLLDITGHFTQTAPDFYKKLSEKEPKGFIGLLDLQLMFVLDNFAGRDGVIYLGTGPVFAYSAFDLSQDGSDFVSEEARAGGVFTLGMGYKAGPIIFKLEPRYYVEKSSYFSGLFGIQAAF
ncbi:MAG: SH3 domain-containing protein [Bdellovibrionales bacterium]|nr:SH3 domain-containing protein [Bdellovibrionales bacterium]